MMTISAALLLATLSQTPPVLALDEALARASGERTRLGSRGPGGAR